MKSTLSFLIGLTAIASASPTGSISPRDSVQGFDVSHYQTNVDFASAYSGGLRFVFIKATEGTTYTDPSFSDHYDAATQAGFIRGGYHFAHGDEDAAAQANFFLENGGGWSDDGITLPGMLDLEGDCATVSWIQTFSDTYYSSTGRYPILYTSPSWWSECTDNSNAFVDTNPLMLARYASSPGTLPGGWPYYTFWQYQDSNTYGGDSDVFNGAYSQLQEIASG